MNLREKQRTLKLTKSIILIKEHNLEDLKRMLKMRNLFEKLDVELPKRKKIFEMYFLNEMKIGTIYETVREIKYDRSLDITEDNIYQIIFEEYVRIATKHIPGFKQPPLRRKYGIKTSPKMPRRPYTRRGRGYLERPSESERPARFEALLAQSEESEEEELGLLVRKKVREVDLELERNNIEFNSKMIEKAHDEKKINECCIRIRESLEKIDKEAVELKKEYNRLLLEVSTFDKCES